MFHSESPGRPITGAFRGACRSGSLARSGIPALLGGLGGLGTCGLVSAAPGVGLRGGTVKRGRGVGEGPATGQSKFRSPAPDGDGVTRGPSLAECTPGA